MLLPPALLATPASPPLLITPSCDDPEPPSTELPSDEPPKPAPPPVPEAPDDPNIADFKSEPPFPTPPCPFDDAAFWPLPLAFAWPLPAPPANPLAPGFCAPSVDPSGLGKGRSPSLLDSALASVGPPFAFLSGPRLLGCCTITSGGAFASEELNNPPPELPLLPKLPPDPLPELPFELLPPKLLLELLPKPPLDPLPKLPPPLPELLPKPLLLEPLLLPKAPPPNDDPLDAPLVPFWFPFWIPFCEPGSPGNPSCWLAGTFESINMPFGPACNNRQSALPVNGSGYSLRRKRMLLVFSRSLNEAG